MPEVNATGYIRESMPTITTLRTHPARPGRVRVEIDGTFAFELSRKVITAKSVTEGESLSVARRRELEGIAAREAAISLLARRERSRVELSAALKRKGFTPALVESTLAQLEQEKLQSDTRFANAWVATRRRLSPRGRVALAFELRQKGISRPEIDAALQKYTPTDERSALRELIGARLARLTPSSRDQQKIKQRLLGFLARRGFAYEDIQQVITEHYPKWR